jgi:hypothetical protein
MPGSERGDTTQMLNKLVNVVLTSIPGLLALCTLLVWGGRLDNRVTNLEGVAKDFKELGSPVLQAYIKKEDEFDAEMVRRIEQNEKTARDLANMLSRLDVLNDKLDNIAYRLNKLEK